MDSNMVKNRLMQHPQWQHVLQISQELRENGHQVVLAGGCVRDALWGLIPQDIDIATSATPTQIEPLFARVLLLGQNFGVCRIVFKDEEPIEVATFREEFDYKNGRHPEVVVFSSMEKDAARRDFTINALFYDIEKEEIVDFVGGQTDLKNKKLRTVGNPQERFSEDYLRLLRAARFAARFSLDVEKTTLKAIQDCAVGLNKVSRERWQDEINKAFAMDKPYLFFDWLRKMHLQEVLFPKWSWTSSFVESFFSVPQPIKWGWAGIFMSAEKTPFQKRRKDLQEFKLSNEILDFINLCEELYETLSNGKGTLESFIEFSKRSQSQEVIAFFKSIKGQITIPMEPFLTDIVEKYAHHGILAEPLLSGNDLLKKGIYPGASMGALLKQSYYYQIKNQIENKDDLLRWVEGTLLKKPTTQ